MQKNYLKKVKCSFMIKKKKPLSKVRIRWKFPNLMKDIYEKATANIKLNGDSFFS